tara:strand:+ start:204 stop:1031 length:828 start_codon:yes stop_codon:yes gene_type:complete
MSIDAHHHFWKYNEADYGWIPDEMSVLRRDFLPADLKTALSGTGVEGVVSVQARQSLEETEWLLSLAAENDFIKGVVGWVPLVSEKLDEVLSGLINYKKLKAVRHVVQDEPDPEFILRDDFNNGIALLQEYDLVYDILVFERHLPQTIEFVDRHPRQQFVLDHIAKPLIMAGDMEPWATNIYELAKRDNVYCKLSGMVTEADIKSWSEAQLKPYFKVVIEAFGPQRLMFGSDWPVCLAASEYSRWLEAVEYAISDFSLEEQRAIMGGNATKVYDL